MKLHVLGIDLGKTVFHLVELDLTGKAVIRKKCSRRQLLDLARGCWNYLTNRLDRICLRNRACMYVLSAHQPPKTTIQTTIVIWMTPTARSFKIENPLC